ncbi:MAG: Gfo/Idh/MocA family oxidoreductase [Planctomycetota bacterium]
MKSSNESIRFRRSCEGTGNLSRRGLLAGSAAVAAFTVVRPSAIVGFPANSRIEVGFVGLGGRGSLIAKMMTKKNHKGYRITALADYFAQVVREAGERLGVPKDRCFSGLSGYRGVIASKVDAVFLETPPCFFPEHASAAVDAGVHVYMAKPVASTKSGTRLQDASKSLWLISRSLRTHSISRLSSVVMRVLLGRQGCFVPSIRTKHSLIRPRLRPSKAGFGI